MTTNPPPSQTELPLRRSYRNKPAVNYAKMNSGLNTTDDEVSFKLSTLLTFSSDDEEIPCNQEAVKTRYTDDESNCNEASDSDGDVSNMDGSRISFLLIDTPAVSDASTQSDGDFVSTADMSEFKSYRSNCFL